MKKGDHVWVYGWPTEKIFAIESIHIYSVGRTGAEKRYAKIIRPGERFNMFLDDLRLIKRKPTSINQLTTVL